MGGKVAGKVGVTMVRSHRGRAPALGLMLVASSGCAQSSEEVCHTVGRDGALLRSVDQVLSIAIYPEALDEDIEVCIAPSDAPPMIAGPAYRVTPSVPLHFTATVTYRGTLPDDTSMTNIGRIDEFAFSQGKGTWRSLGDCRVESAQRLVRCTDDELAAFYGLLDEVIGNTADTVADSIGDESSDEGVDPTTMTAGMTSTPETTDSGDTEDPIIYPAECDALAAGPFTVDAHGLLFPPSGEDNGAEDLAMDGNGGFVGRSGDGLIRVDMDSLDATMLEGVPEIDSSTLGMRYLANGDLAMLQRAEGTLQVLAGATLEVELEDLQLPNAVYPDPNGMLWLSEFTAGRITRWDRAAGGAPVEIATGIGGANGVVFDPLRSIAFFVGYNDGQLWRTAIAADGAAIGQAVLVTELDGNSDGVALDVCGNLYIVDQGGAGGFVTAGNTSRLDRVRMNDLGELELLEQIATLPDAQVANVAFGDGAFASTVFLTGLPGEVFSIDVQIDGAPTAVTP